MGIVNCCKAVLKNVGSISPTISHYGDTSNNIKPRDLALRTSTEIVLTIYATLLGKNILMPLIALILQDITASVLRHLRDKRP